MKKLIFLVFSISLIFVFGCGNDDENNSGNSAQDTTLYPGYEEFSADDANEFTEDMSETEVAPVEETVIEEETNDNVMVENEVGEPVPATNEDLNDASKSFYIVVGSYQNIDNAQKRMKYFQKLGYIAEVLPKFGAYNRVSVASFNEENAARDELKLARNKFNDPSYWLLYR